MQQIHQCHKLPAEYARIFLDFLLSNILQHRQETYDFLQGASTQ